MLLKILAIFYVLNNACAQSDTLFYRNNLSNTLFSSYNKNIRPTEKIVVGISVNIFEIVSLIEKEQVIVLNMMVSQFWNDTRLAWNPLDFGNVTKLFVPSDKLWT